MRTWKGEPPQDGGDRRIHRTIGNRVLDEMMRLAAGPGAGPQIRATAYLKQCAYDRDLEAVWRERGLPDDLPMAVCQADICRPEWLCEIEVTAARPRGRGA